MSAEPTVSVREDAADLAARLRGRLVTADDADYDQVRAVWNGMIDKRPALIARWVDDTVDLIEFANGGTDTEWGAKRAALGHPESFGLDMIGLGNEENTTTFEQNFPKFRDAIEAKCPRASICVPCCCGSAPASKASLLKAWAENGTPAVALGLLKDGFANGDFGIVFERTNEAS